MEGETEIAFQNVGRPLSRAFFRSKSAKNQKAEGGKGRKRLKRSLKRALGPESLLLRRPAAIEEEKEEEGSSKKASGERRRRFSTPARVRKRQATDIGFSLSLATKS